MDKNELVIKDMSDQVFSMISKYEQAGQLTMPKDYSVENAIKSAYLTLLGVKDKNGKNALEVCEKRSIANALTDMVIQGLSPAKKQCYFIARGSELTMMRSYFGSQTALKRLPNIKDVYAYCIYKGDTIETGFVDGKEVVTKHDTKFENRDNEIVGAYAIIEKNDGEKVYTIMTKKEIDACWSKSSSRDHNVHNEFPQEMTKRTVINRACKNYINTCTDDDVLVGAFNRTTENEYDNEVRIQKDERTIDVVEVDVVEPSEEVNIDDVDFE